MVTFFTLRPTMWSPEAGVGGDTPLQYRDIDHVAICIPTYKRPRNLRDLLLSIHSLDRASIDIRVIVVDNDAERSAQPVVENVLGDASIPYFYDCVVTPNLPSVRNRLLELAQRVNTDWIWLIDDDQIVEPDALRRMLNAAEEYQADCVVARVPHIYDESPGSWAQWSGIFEEIHRPTGQPTKRFGTNGPLFRTTALHSFGQRFDPTLGFVGGHHGGEDGMFLSRFQAAGFKIVGCDEAVIRDRVHASRNNPRWLSYRALRIGLIKGIIIREINPSLSTSAKWLFAGVGYAALNFATMSLLIPFGPSRYFRRWIRSVEGYGVALGVLTGRRYLRGKEPVTAHGS